MDTTSNQTEGNQTELINDSNPMPTEPIAAEAPKTEEAPHPLLAFIEDIIFPSVIYPECIYAWKFQG